MSDAYTKSHSYIIVLHLLRVMAIEKHPGIMTITMKMVQKHG